MHGPYNSNLSFTFSWCTNVLKDSIGKSFESSTFNLLHVNKVVISTAIINSTATCLLRTNRCELFVQFHFVKVLCTEFTICAKYERTAKKKKYIYIHI